MAPSIRGSALKSSVVLKASIDDTGRRARSTRWRALRPLLKPKIVIGVGIVLALIIAGALAPWIAPYDPNAQDLAMALKPPQWLFGAHVLGTDAVGRDILSRLFYGARISLIIAVMVVLISGVVGVGLGAVSGYFAGAVDFLIQKFVEVDLGVSTAAACHRHYGISRPGSWESDLGTRDAALDFLLPGRARSSTVDANT